MSANTAPRVCHVNDRIVGAVYIGRQMKRRNLLRHPLSNPYLVDLHGRAGAIALYRMHLAAILRRGHDEDLNALLVLRSAPAIACWCRRDGEQRTTENECHGDVIVEFLSNYTDAQLRAMKR